MASSRSNDALLGYMVQLRRHLLKCYDCKGALSTGESERMCMAGRLLTLNSALEYNGVLELRRKALSHGEGLIYACPDLSKHSESYALTAQLFKIAGLQGELF